jgi:hypothetical protein
MTRCTTEPNLGMGGRLARTTAGTHDDWEHYERNRQRSRLVDESPRGADAVHMIPVTGRGGSLSPGGIADELFDPVRDLIAGGADFGGPEAYGVVECRWRFWSSGETVRLRLFGAVRG